MISRVVLLVQIALRNLRASPINMLVGFLILFGALFFVVMGSFLDSLASAMARSVVGSLAGDIQVYGAKSKDEIALYGGGMGGDQDLAVITEYPKIKAALTALPNVKSVVPMGMSSAIVPSGNVIDVTLAQLRDLYAARKGTAHDAALNTLPREELDRRIASEAAHVRQMIKVLESEARKAMEIVEGSITTPENVAALARVSQDAFWTELDQDPEPQLEFLENRVAPQVSDAQMLFLRYVGTDLEAFQDAFDRMEIKKGTRVPKGQRGFLIADLTYEEQMKLKNARRLDKIRDARATGRLIANDDELKRFVKENRTQTKDIVLQLDGLRTGKAVAGLQKLLDDPGTELAPLLEKFFDTTDETFDARYKYFYGELAPMLEMYRVRLGDSLTIKTFTRSGYMQAVNVRVYGTFAFKGLESSPLAGSVCLMDIVSFRELYGYLTADRAEELKQIQRAAGTKTVSRENAEAELFGDDATLETTAAATTIDLDKELAGAKEHRQRAEELARRSYTQAEIDDGVVLHAAVLLRDATKTGETIEQINALSDAQHLGLKAVPWQQAAGLLGQLITALKAVLFVSVGLIFFIAMIIINNAMMMATLQRTQMIGTLRAIGAQRAFVLGMVLNESLVLGVLFGGGGLALGAAFMAWMHTRGIPAFNDQARFFFSGPRLVPDLSPGSLLVAMVLILLVTVGSTLIPAFIATRISPLRAMQSDE